MNTKSAVPGTAVPSLPNEPKSAAELCEAERQCWCGGALALSVHPLYGKCTRCGTQVLRRKYTEDQLKQFYGYQQYWHVHQTTVSGYPAIEQRAKDDFQDRIPFWHQLLASHRASPRRLLEFGCAHGGFLHYCREKGIPEVVGVEVDEATCKFARENFRLPHVFSGLFPDVQLPFDQFDVICSFDVIEHFLDPVRALRQVAQLLAPGGMCLFQTPCYRGEGAEWLQFRPQEHIFLYNEQSIRRLFAQCDLEVSEILPGYFPDDMFVFGRKRQPGSSPTLSLSSGQPEEPKRILWARTDAIGDAVLASSQLEPLHRRFPQAQLAVLCQQHVADLFAACPFVNSIICYDRNKVEADPAERAQITAEIAAFKPDLILNSVRSRDRLSDELTLAFAEARHAALAGDLDNISAADRETAAAQYDLLIVSPDEHRTELQRHADFLRGLGIETQKLQPVVWTGPDDELLADGFFKAQGLRPDNTIAVCPGAQQAIRLYPHYVEALKSLDGFHFLVFGDAGQTRLAEDLGQAFPGRTVNLCGRTTLREMAALVRRCRLYVGAETAGAHIACAVGTPNVVVLGGGHFGRFMPCSPLTTAVSLPLDCFGCNWHCKFSHAYCVRNLAPQALAEAINATLQGRSKKSRLFVQTDPVRQPLLNQMLAPFVPLDALELVPVTIAPAVPARLPALQFGAGVHQEEPGFRWLDTEAELQVSVPAEGPSWRLSFELQTAALALYSGKPVRVEIRSGETLARELVFETDHQSEIVEISLPPQAQPHVIQLKSSAGYIGQNDNRRLAVRLQNLSLTAQPAATAEKRSASQSAPQVRGKSSAARLPKITIITPSYNQGEFLEDTFRSVLDQNYPNLEYFVVDGGSQDNSVEIIKRYAKHFDWWVSEKDRGQSHAINKGLERATGDIVTWLNSDDFFYPGALDYIAQAWLAHPDAGLFIGNGTLADRQGRRVRRYSKTLAWDYDILLRGANYVLQPATFLARRVFEEQGFIDEKITYGMDLELWLRVGNKYPVVTIDEELAAFRWYDEVKSVAGGFKEWIAMYEMTRRYCQDPITPGLVLEFFKKLQDTKVQAAAGFQDFGKFANAYYWKFYNELQTVMHTADCIPLVNKGIPFVPDKTHRAGQQMCQKPSISLPGGSAAGPAHKVDVVLPAGHSWFVREGYVEALKASGNLGRVFYVPSWQNDELQSRELFEYLKQPESDAIFLMDTLWHAQPVHATAEWRQRWAQCPAKKIMFSFECMNNPVIRANPKWWQDNLKAVENAAAGVDAVIYAHEIDGELFRQYGLASLWQPFAVDPSIFPPLKKFEDRQARGFFKGKAERFYNDDNCYRERRELIAYLRQHAPNVVVQDQYSSSGGGVRERNEQFIREMGEYQIVVGLPSLSPTMVVRPFEAMLSGCVFFQNRIAGEESNQLFKDGEHFVLYDASKPEELVRKINEVAADPARGRRIAENGRQEVLAKHTIRHRVAAALAWLEQVPTPAATRQLPDGGDAQSKRKKIVIDGVIFDIQRGRQHGISRVWHRLLEQLAQTPLAEDIVLFDRDGTAPAIPGIRKRMVAAYDYQRFEVDSLWLQRWCDEENAALFISTYFTWAETTPTVIMLHDMIPELTGQNLQHPEWRAKVKAMGKAMGYFAVSQSTVNDFQRLYPEMARRKLFLTPNAVGDEFKAADPDAVRAFRQKYHLRKPYFLLVGNRALYKNASLFFKAFAQLPNRNQFEIVCTGGADKLEKEFEPWVADATCQVLRLSNAELCAAYSGATALVYPSLYEGFGLPILEAQKCGCPVITGRNSSLPEVAGEAAIFLNDSNEATMVQALAEVQREDLRQQLIAAGTPNAQRYSWEKTGRVLAGAIEDFRARAVHAPLRARDPINTIRRLIFMADELGATGKNLGRHLRTISWQCEAFEYYDRAEMGAAEAAVAVCLNQLGAPFIKQFAPVPELDNLTALALGLAAEARNDFPQAWACYSQAIAHVGKGIYGFRVALRLARVAARGGDAAASEKVLQQLVSPLRHSLPPKLDAAAEEAALQAWEPVLPNVDERTHQHPSTQHKAPVPLVSAIVSTFKSERFLRGCLEDLEAQTIADRLEIIVVDSHSPQNERAIVEEFQKKYGNIVYIRTQERETVYGAWNRGARAARGKYLTNANTDDRHRPDALEILARTLDQHPDVALVYADCLVTYHENETYYTANPLSCYHWLDFSPRNLWVEGCFCGPQPMWRREVHEEHGYFDAQMVSAGDYEFWLRLAQNRKFLHVEKTLGLYLKSPTSVEHANREIGAKEVQISRERYRECIMNGKPPFRPQLPEPTVAVEVMIPAGHGSVTKAMAPKPAPAVARVGRLDEARALFGSKDYAGAWAETATAIGKRPFHPEAFLLLAEIALAVGAGKVAKLCAQQARQFAPDWAAPRQFLAKPLKGDVTPAWLDPSRITHHASRMSVCLIVKNEEKFLAQCLKSVRDLAAQIVVVDTGSTDRTVEIAREFGAEIHAFSWCDDFAAARNAALEHATGDWVLMLDADEELPAAQHARLRADMSDATTMAFRLPLVNAGQENEGRSFVPRLFRNLPGAFFTGRIHEQIFASLIERTKNWGLKTALGTAELLHHGYAREMVRDRNKVERNLKLLRAAIEEAPADVNLVMNLGLELVRSGDVPAGVERYREAFALMSAQPPAAVVPELREVLLTQFTSQLYKVRAHEEVVRVLNSPLAQHGGLTASLHFALGLAYFELKQFSEAAQQMWQCLKSRHQACLTPINTDIHTAAPQHCLALSLSRLGDAAGAEKAFLAALAETGHAEAAKLDYAKFLRAQERPVDALHRLHEIVSLNPRQIAAWQIGGEITLSRAEFLEVARDWTAEAFQALPENPVIAAQRAEALMLNGETPAATELWERLWRSEPAAHALAALILCRIAEKKTIQFPVTDEQGASLAFVTWYQKLLAVRAQALTEKINGRLELVASVLPTAAKMLEAALSEAGAPA